MSRSSFCDRCGSPLTNLASATLRLRFDAREVLVEAALCHAACPIGEPAPGERIEHLPAAEAIAPEAAARLLGLARVHGASAGRVRRKLLRLTAPVGTRRSATR